MIKYGSQFNPLHEPTRADCLFRLGCCFEDDEEVMQQYPFMPRCYHRVADTVVDDRLNEFELVRKGKFGGDYNAVCGAGEISTFLQKHFNNAAGTASILAKINTAAYSTKGITYTQGTNTIAIAAGDWTAQTCLYVNKEMGDIPNEANNNQITSFDYFDIFNRKRVIAEDLEKSKIPADLQSMYNEMF
jgi:hypothetical protein